jgi:hypothetical protein
MPQRWAENRNVDIGIDEVIYIFENSVLEKRN